MTGSSAGRWPNQATVCESHLRRDRGGRSRCVATPPWRPAPFRISWQQAAYDAACRSVPVMVLERLAVNAERRDSHLGASLLQDAVNRAVAVSQNAGVRALLVHALHERADSSTSITGFNPRRRIR